jgi:hypothetical protein
VNESNDEEAFQLVFDSQSISRLSSWSPGIALPICVVFVLVVVPWVQPALWWLATVVVVGAAGLWLWAPYNFWIRGTAPTIEVSESRLRITTRDTSRTEPLDHFELAEISLGDGWVLTKERTFASIDFLWNPALAPGVAGFVKEHAWHVDLPLRGRDRRVTLTQVAADLAAHGLAAELVDTNPREQYSP